MPKTSKIAKNIKKTTVVQKTSKSEKRVRPKRLMSLWQLLVLSWRMYRAQWRRLAVVGAIVLVPSALIRAASTTNWLASVDLSLVLYLASLYCVLALIWLLTKPVQAEGKRWPAVYVASSARFLPLLATSLALILAAVPALFGFVIVLLAGALVVPGAFVPLGLAAAAISIWLLVRLSLAFWLAVGEELPSWQAILGSWRLTKWRSWRLVLDYLVLIALIVVSTGVPLFMIGLIPVVGSFWLIQGVVSGLLLSIALPLWLVFVSNVYEELREA